LLVLVVELACVLLTGVVFYMCFPGEKSQRLTFVDAL
jgi:hypothetical protein